jgi:hypothetical protein
MEVFRIAGVGNGVGGWRWFVGGSFRVRWRFVGGSFGVCFLGVVVCFVGVAGFVSDLPFFWGLGGRWVVRCEAVSDIIAGIIGRAWSDRRIKRLILLRKNAVTEVGT